MLFNSFEHFAAASGDFEFLAGPSRERLPNRPGWLRGAGELQDPTGKLTLRSMEALPIGTRETGTTA